MKVRCYICSDRQAFPADCQGFARPACCDCMSHNGLKAWMKPAYPCGCCGKDSSCGKVAYDHDGLYTYVCNDCY